MKKRMLAIFIIICTVFSAIPVFAAQDISSTEYKRLPCTIELDANRPAPTTGVISVDAAAEAGMKALWQYFNPYFQQANGCKIEMFYNSAPSPQDLSRIDARNRTIGYMSPSIPPEQAKWSGIIHIKDADAFIDTIQFVFSVNPVTGGLIGIERIGGATKEAVGYEANTDDISDILVLATKFVEQNKLITGGLSSTVFKRNEICVVDTDSLTQTRLADGTIYSTYLRQVTNETIAITVNTDMGEKIKLVYRSYDKTLLSVLDNAISYAVYATIFN